MEITFLGAFPMEFVEPVVFEVQGIHENDRKSVCIVSVREQFFDHFFGLDARPFVYFFGHIFRKKAPVFRGVVLADVFRVLFRKLLGQAFIAPYRVRDSERPERLRTVVRDPSAGNIFAVLFEFQLVVLRKLLRKAVELETEVGPLLRVFDTQRAEKFRTGLTFRAGNKKAKRIAEGQRRGHVIALGLF